MNSALFMPNKPNFRSSKTEHQVVTGQRVSTRCRLNRLVRSVASCERSEKGGQGPVEQRGGAGDARKAPNEPNWNRPLIACPEGVNIDGCGPVYAERTQFPGRRGRDIGGLTIPKPARRRTRPSGFWIMPQAGTHAARNGTAGWHASCWQLPASPQRKGLGSGAVDPSYPEL
jgi:hypothetical protein